MCGRFTITADRVEIILKRFQAELAPGFDNYRPRYNAAPGQFVPTIVAKEDGKRYLTNGFWGFVPPWGEKGGDIDKYQANIRDDTIARNKFFRDRLLKNRCVFVADGFYEWQKPPGYEHLERGQKLPRGVRKIPHRITHASGEVFPLAGLWRTVKREEETVISAGIITTGPNKLMAPIHDRMPVILDDGDLEAWLSPDVSEFDALHELLDPCPDDELKAYVVSDIVNNSRFDDPRVIQPAT